MKKSNIVLILFAVFADGVFGDTEAVKSVSLMEGDTVTLYTNVTKQHHDIMRWYFNNTRIALINGGPSTSCVYDGGSGRFRDRLKVDYKTGSLTITDIRAEHAGRYEAELIIIKSSGTTKSFNRPRKCDSTKIYEKNSDSEDIIKRFSLTVSASDSGKNKDEGLTEPELQDKETSVFGDTEAVKSASLMEGDPVTLYTNVTKQHHDTMRWYFNNTRIALINGGPSTSCVYDGADGIFRDRLKVDYKTGSLIITNITTEHAGRYEAELIIIKSSGTTKSLNRPRKCDSTKIYEKNSDSEDIIKRFSLTVSASDSGKNKDEGLTEPELQDKETSSGLSPAVVAGIVGGVVVVVVLLVAAAVLVYRKKIDHCIFRKFKAKPSENQQVSNDETQNERSLMI